jgi:hypothetical protein
MSTSINATDTLKNICFQADPPSGGEDFTELQNYLLWLIPREPIVIGVVDMEEFALTESKS